MRRRHWVLLPMAALLVTSCSNQIVDGAATTATKNASGGRGGNAQIDEWGEIGAMGKGSPDFPTDWPRHRLTTEWDAPARAFENTLSYIRSSRGPTEMFKPTMNGCDNTEYLIRWRAVADGVQITAHSVDSVENIISSVTAEEGWLHLDGCHTVAFEFGSSDRGGNLADVTATVQMWRPAA